MGCDIHIIAQRRDGEGRWQVIPWPNAPGIPWYNKQSGPFDWRQYAMFGFLADVRNYAGVPTISEPRGLPEDLDPDSDHDLGDHSLSWLSVAELLAQDYDQPFENVRVTRQEGPNIWNGAAIAEPGEGRMTTLREELGEAFFRDLERLRELGAERVVFGFDS